MWSNASSTDGPFLEVHAACIAGFQPSACVLQRDALLHARIPRRRRARMYSSPAVVVRMLAVSSYRHI
jgi:hypothetical protein